MSLEGFRRPESRWSKVARNLVRVNIDVTGKQLSSLVSHGGIRKSEVGLLAIREEDGYSGKTTTAVVDIAGTTALIETP